MAEVVHTQQHQLDVHLVSPRREVWSGHARYVVARSVSGDLGVLPGHEPTMTELGVGPVRIERDGETPLIAAVDGGFLSVSTVANATRVDILGENIVVNTEVNEADLRQLEAHSEELKMKGMFAEARTEYAKALTRRRLGG